MDRQVTLDGWTAQEHPQVPGAWEEAQDPTQARRPLCWGCFSTAMF